LREKEEEDGKGYEGGRGRRRRRKYFKFPCSPKKTEGGGSKKEDLGGKVTRRDGNQNAAQQSEGEVKTVNL